MTRLGASSRLCIIALGVYVNPLFCSPDRWNDLPDKVKEIPGLYNHLLTFSAGPRVSLFEFIHLA